MNPILTQLQGQLTIHDLLVNFLRNPNLHHLQGQPVHDNQGDLLPLVDLVLLMLLLVNQDDMNSLLDVPSQVSVHSILPLLLLLPLLLPLVKQVV